MGLFSRSGVSRSRILLTGLDSVDTFISPRPWMSTIGRDWRPGAQGFWQPLPLRPGGMHGSDAGDRCKLSLVRFAKSCQRHCRLLKADLHDGVSEAVHTIFPVGIPQHCHYDPGRYMRPLHGVFTQLLPHPAHSPTNSYAELSEGLDPAATAGGSGCLGPAPCSADRSGVTGHQHLPEFQDSPRPWRCLVLVVGPLCAG